MTIDKDNNGMKIILNYIILNILKDMLISFGRKKKQ